MHGTANPATPVRLRARPPNPALTAIVITNNRSFTIHTGTPFAITADRRPSWYKSDIALGPGRTLTVGGYGPVSTCNVSVPG